MVAEPVQFNELRPANQTTATLDMEATLAETANRSAKRCYKGYPAYQPLNVYWFEAEQVLFSEFRDGNCAASWRLQEVLEEGLTKLPDSIDTVQVRSDTAGYDSEFLRWMADANSV